MYHVARPSAATTASLTGKDSPDSLTFQHATNLPGPPELVGRYQEILEESRLSWIEHHRLIRRLGSGGRGSSTSASGSGPTSSRCRSRLKIFSPEGYADAPAYDEAMARMAQVAVRVAQIQQDNLIDVHNFIEHNRIRLMEMEWVDGYDLQRLLSTGDARASARPGQRRPLGVPQRRDRHGRRGPAAAQAGGGDRGAPRLPGGALGACTARGSSTATSSRRTSCSSAPATPS